MDEKDPLEQKRSERIQKRVRKLKSFYSNVITYVLVNVLLLILNFALSPNSLWFYWVTLIWGAVLLVQAVNIFTIRDHFLGEEWEERKQQELMEKERRRQRK